MDFSTIERKLAAGGYPTVQGFIFDVNLIFSNSRLYNEKGSEVQHSNMTTFIYSLMFTHTHTHAYTHTHTHTYTKKHCIDDTVLSPALIIYTCTILVRLFLVLFFFLFIFYSILQMNKITIDMQELFDMRMPHLLDGYVVKPYRRHALRTLATSTFCSSVSSLDDSSIVSTQDQHRGGGASVSRRAKERRGGSTRRGRRRAVEASNNADTSDSAEDAVGGHSSTKSFGECRLNVNHQPIRCAPLTRRQTRSMRKESPLPPSPDEVLVDKDGFSMTLRARSQRVKKRLHSNEDTAEEEETEVEEGEEEIVDKGSEEDNSMGSRARGRRRSCPKEEERPTRSLRIRPKRTKYSHFVCSLDIETPSP